MTALIVPNQSPSLKAFPEAAPLTQLEKTAIKIKYVPAEDELHSIFATTFDAASNHANELQRAQEEEQEEEKKTGPAPEDVFMDLNLLEPDHDQRDSVHEHRNKNVDKAENRKCCCLCRAIYKVFFKLTSCCRNNKENEPNLPSEMQASEAQLLALQAAGLI